MSYGDASVDVRYLTPKLSLTQLVGFNNTGNVCVWPSEECLAVYCLQNRQIFRDKNVLELGGGMTSLAGFLVASAADPRLVHLTDGNSDSVRNISHSVERFKEEKNICVIDTFELRWDDTDKVGGLVNSYHVIICADCLFFKDSSSSLVHSLYKMLKKMGKVIVMAPNREETFGKFEELARTVFSVEVIENYCNEVWKAHESWIGSECYVPDIHYPKLMVLTKE